LCIYYDQDLALARDLDGRMSMGRTYCTIMLYLYLFRYYDQDLALARDLEDRMSMKRAYYTIMLYLCLFRYYDQDLALARDLEDRMSMGRAYCNLGLAHLAIGNMENALECQKYFLGK
jgi:hypothetical protein